MPFFSPQRHSGSPARIRRWQLLSAMGSDSAPEYPAQANTEPNITPSPGYAFTKYCNDFIAFHLYLHTYCNGHFMLLYSQKCHVNHPFGGV
jgi:hypothetical protein